MWQRQRERERERENIIRQHGTRKNSKVNFKRFDCARVEISLSRAQKKTTIKTRFCPSYLIHRAHDVLLLAFFHLFYSLSLSLFVRLFVCLCASRNEEM